MRAKPIEWREAPHGFRHGLIGGVRLFSYGWDATRAKGSEDLPWLLSCDLPGIGRSRCALKEECEQRAEATLNRFLRLIAEDA